MGQLVDGTWEKGSFSSGNSALAKGGAFKRAPTSFRGEIGGREHPAAAGRYHLYVSLACPWAHRTLIVRSLKGLNDMISVSVVGAYMGDEGWVFASEPGAIADSVLGANALHEVYTAADRHYTGRVTVPVLWDKEAKTIVNNESAEIIRIFNTAFNDVGGNKQLDLYPEALRAEIDAVNHRVYETVNNGVYRCGFATTQEAYDEAVGPLFASLQWLEERLEGKRYLVGDTLTEADVRLFTTLVRFDPVYATHFKCNKKRLVEFKNLWAFTRRIHQTPGVRETVNLDHIKRHYFLSHPHINPHRIIPVGFDVDLDEPVTG